jgi:hypothetical protein
VVTALEGLVTLCAAVLMVAGSSKLTDLKNFTSQVKAYDILPSRTAGGLAVILPFAEILAGGLLLIIPPYGGALGAVLFGSFAVAITINVIKGRTELVCGCFGPTGRHTIGVSHIGSNLALLTICVAGATRTSLPSIAGVMVGATLSSGLLLLSAFTSLLATSKRTQVEEA